MDKAKRRVLNRSSRRARSPFDRLRTGKRGIYHGGAERKRERIQCCGYLRLGVPSLKFPQPALEKFPEQMIYSNQNPTPLSVPPPRSVAGILATACPP
jgi:hypothetical protein